MSNEGPQLLMAGAFYELCIYSKAYGERKRAGFCPGHELPRIVQASLKELTEVDDVEPTVHFQNSVRTCYLSKNHSAVKLQKWEF